MIPRIYFTNIEELHTKCKLAIEKRDNPIEVVEYYTPCYLNDKERRREAHIEILRPDGYYESIYFKIGEEDKMKEVYNELKVYNREITPLEKFHASF